MANEGLIYGVKLAAADRGIEMSDAQARAFVKQAAIGSAVRGIAGGAKGLAGAVKKTPGKGFGQVSPQNAPAAARHMDDMGRNARELPEHIREAIRRNPIGTAATAGSAGVLAGAGTILSKQEKPELKFNWPPQR